LLALANRFVALLLSFSGAVLAENTPALRLLTDSECPGSDAVETELKLLLPQVTFDGSADARLISIYDLGARYRVAVAGQQRELVDEARACAERARAAAAFVFLVLHPPSLPPPIAMAPRARPQLEVELAGLVAGAPRTSPDNDLVSGGGSLRAVLHARYVGGSLGVEGLAPAVMSFGTVKVRLWRVPIDLSLRGLLPLGGIELAADVGVAFTILGTEGLGLFQTHSATRFDPGVRAALAARFWLTRHLGLALGIESTVSFQRFPLALGSSEIGSTPIVWLAGSAGLAVRIH
jgi:hypothetical protein